MQLTASPKFSVIITRDKKHVKKLLRRNASLKVSVFLPDINLDQDETDKFLAMFGKGGYPLKLFAVDPSHDRLRAWQGST